MENKQFKKYNHVNPEILKMILKSSIKCPKVLDVGCWTGALGSELKNNIDCTIDGIDNNEDVLSLAKNVGYNNLYRIDLNIDFNSNLIKDKYDFIVFGDVLEHTINPNKLISLFKEKLKDNGFILVSLPNIGFILYRILHLLGFWSYTDIGVMDKTHLRFFTLNSMKKLFESTNLEILKSVGINIVKKRFLLLSPLGKLYPSLFATQIVFLLNKKI
ncbi:class I SAM-dependent methyltransferase [Patescibacteria group bacterium]|nr:class I SAM-dependent methyltransferase [Patescibacteria group bacterium]MBU4098403.1 class I SAM-dependent methyltransferase [Patescibacteria group bacterium]